MYKQVMQLSTKKTQQQQQQQQNFLETLVKRIFCKRKNNTTELEELFLTSETMNSRGKKQWEPA